MSFCLHVLLFSSCLYVQFITCFLTFPVTLVHLSFCCDVLFSTFVLLFGLFFILLSWNIFIVVLQEDVKPEYFERFLVI